MAPGGTGSAEKNQLGKNVKSPLSTHPKISHPTTEVHHASLDSSLLQPSRASENLRPGGPAEPPAKLRGRWHRGIPVALGREERPGRGSFGLPGSRHWRSDWLSGEFDQEITCCPGG